MPSIKEIRTHIKSVEETLKITNAMYLISSSSLRKAKKQLDDVRPYFDRIFNTIADILHHAPETEHIYFDHRPQRSRKRVGYIVITGDKGLAGAYNHNVLKLAEHALTPEHDDTLFVVGQIGRAYFAQKDIPVDGEFLYTAQAPTVYRAQEISDTMVDLFRRGALDEVYVIYTRMITPLHLEPKLVRLLPLDRDIFPWKPRGEERYTQMVRYVPTERAVLDQIVPGFLKGILFGTLVESYCSEQSARMTAMDTSSQNARALLKELNLSFNRARQAAITQEITEIVGGARAEGR